ncbi:MAG: Thiaminase II (EC involved in salvage of thiamin pyrimidine moiety [uncultured Sulfurovum sp.]|uniref:Aminopyrimidine aminohydrolase n=1 Tax=uncultured Sulfurovum sp. TaxID=269237 RepID=A0A6S6TMJ8_9BACT|nr:MAG: Thiaminase II (EC involved in salvage of thiamin pyrimidine moiety [uncultured Sulfurovum sp.]
MNNWYDEIRVKTEPVFQEIINHGFIKDLMAGTLSKDAFGFYVNQDTLYLAEYTKVLSQVGIKCYEAEETQFYLESATGIIEVEKALHQVFLDKKYVDKEVSPTCELYVSYMARIVNNYSVEVGLAAVLPCFSIYKEVGDYMIAHQSNKDSNPYQTWIDTYAGEEFAASVAEAIKITNKYAATASPENLKLMEEVFLKTSKMEWMFWDSAYKQEKWAV